MTFYNFTTFIRSEFKFRDQVLIAIIVACLLGLILGTSLLLLPPLREIGWLVIEISQAAAEWTGLLLLLLNGTIMQSKYWWYIIGSLLIILVSILFRIMHYSGAMELLLLGCILLELVYTIRFINQRYTSPSGWFKYGWICSWCFTSVGMSIHKLSAPYSLIPAVLFWITILLYLREKMRVASKYKNNTQFTADDF